MARGGGFNANEVLKGAAIADVEAVMYGSPLLPGQSAFVGDVIDALVDYVAEAFPDCSEGDFVSAGVEAHEGADSLTDTMSAAFNGVDGAQFRAQLIKIAGLKI